MGEASAAKPRAVGASLQHDDTTENVYIVAGGTNFGRAFFDTTLPWAPPVAAYPNPILTAGCGNGGDSSGIPSNSGPACQTLPPPPLGLHVYTSVPDPLQSASFVLDLGTGEMVEAISYQPYGGVDSDWRSPRWNTPREDQRYTGQWDNAEVGLVYMHARYYSPQLGRFVSPDPLTIHSAKGDLNPYAYARGNPFRFADPSGLAPTPDTPENPMGYEQSFLNGWIGNTSATQAQWPPQQPPPPPAPGYTASNVGSTDNGPVPSTVATAQGQDSPQYPNAVPGSAQWMPFQSGRFSMFGWGGYTASTPWNGVKAEGELLGVAGFDTLDGAYAAGIAAVGGESAEVSTSVPAAAKRVRP